MSAVVFADKTVTYNGESHSIFATGMPNGVSVSYENNNKINADEYTITAIFTGDSTNYNAIENKTATLTINKATYDMSGISFVGDTVTYDGNVHSLAITGTLPNGVTVSYENNDRTNADVYTVIAKFTDTTGNYENPANKTATLTINKATYNMDGVVFADKIVTYNGNAYSIEAQNVPSGLSVSYTGNDKTNVDTYTVTATFTDTTGNYENPQNMTATLTINKATIMGITLTDKTFTYDTKTHALAIDGNLPACVKVTYTNNDKVNANTYTATASFADTSGNYIVPNDMSAKLIINKATVSGITFDNKTFTYNGTKRSLEISGTLPEESSFFTSVGKPFPAVCIRTSTERPEALDKACFVLAGIDEKSLVQAVETAVDMNENSDYGIPVPTYVEENVSTKVVKLIQSYTGVVNKMVWRKF